jgi:hypothetical protein
LFVVFSLWLVFFGYYMIKITIFTLLTGTLAHASILNVQVANYLIAETFYTDTNVTNPSGDLPSVTHAFNQYSGDVEDLISFTISWDITHSIDLLSSAGGGGNMNQGGAYSVNSINYAGNGGGDEGPVPSDIPTNFSSQATASNVFLKSGAGSSYDPAILTAILGNGTFDVSWGGPSTTGNFSFTGEFDSISAQIAEGSFASVTFETVPEPSQSGLLAGFVALGLLMIRRRKFKPRKFGGES